MQEKISYKIYNKEKNIKKTNIEIGVGLNKIDNLTPSKYFYEAVDSSKTYSELEKKLQHYHSANGTSADEIQCDIVATHIAENLSQEGFTFSYIALKTIHKKLFTGAFPQFLEKYVGVFRSVNIYKNEKILNGNSVSYADFNEITELLEYDFKQEKQNSYANKEELAKKVANFISSIWQIHPFIEGNTRTVAIFCIKYLRQKGFNIDNEIFKENAKYFRNALVLANFEDFQNDIKADFSYIYSFFNKALLDNNLELKPLPKSVYDNQQA